MGHAVIGVVEELDEDLLDLGNVLLFVGAVSSLLVVHDVQHVVDVQIVLRHRLEEVPDPIVHGLVHLLELVSSLFEFLRVPIYFRSLGATLLLHWCSRFQHLTVGLLFRLRFLRLAGLHLRGLGLCRRRWLGRVGVRFWGLILGEVCGGCSSVLSSFLLVVSGLVVLLVVGELTGSFSEIQLVQGLLGRTVLGSLLVVEVRLSTLILLHSLQRGLYGLSLLFEFAGEVIIQDLLDGISNGDCMDLL